MGIIQKYMIAAKKHCATGAILIASNKDGPIEGEKRGKNVLIEFDRDGRRKT